MGRGGGETNLDSLSGPKWLTTASKSDLRGGGIIGSQTLLQGGTREVQSLLGAKNSSMDKHRGMK